MCSPRGHPARACERSLQGCEYNSIVRGQPWLRRRPCVPRGRSFASTGVARSAASQSRGSADGAQPAAVQRSARPRSNTHARRRSDVRDSVARRTAGRRGELALRGCTVSRPISRATSVSRGRPVRHPAPCASVRRVRKELGSYACGGGHVTRSRAMPTASRSCARRAHSLRGRGRSFGCVHGIILTPLILGSPILPRICHGRGKTARRRGCPRGADATHTFHPGVDRSICYVCCGPGCEPC